jgi:pimeloyl-ACP methyl ester carboxylesterase
MRPDFLRSSSFRNFVDGLDFNLLAQENEQFSFSGKLKGEYFSVLSQSFTFSTLQDESFNDFLNKTNVSLLLRNSNFLQLLDSIPAFVWRDSDFTAPLARFSPEVLTNSKFVGDIQKLSYEALTTPTFKDLLSKFTSADLLRSGEQYVSIVANSSPFLKGATRETYGLDNPRLISGGENASPVSSSEKVIGFRKIRNDNISPDSQTWIIIHGYDDDTEELTTQVPLQQSVLRNAKPNDRILALDWREAAANQSFRRGNFTAATWSAPVAEYVVKMLNDAYGVSSNSAKDSVNLVGHSLGAYVAGEIGKVYKNVNGIGVRTITALDPASSRNNLVAESILEQGDSPYDMDGRIAGPQAPQAFSAVSRFSRAFNGISSKFGNERAAATATEAIAMSFDEQDRALNTYPLGTGEEHFRVARAFAKIDEQPGRIGKNLGIKAYGDTSGTLGLKQWQEIPELPLAGTNRSYKAVLDVDSTNQSKSMFGLRNAGTSDNIVLGGKGADSLGGLELVGYPGSLVGDARYSGTGSDIIYGEDGVDILLGGSDNDALIGGTGADVLTGGPGKDIFVLSAGDGSSNINATNRITDFDASAGDLLGLDVAGLTFDKIRITGGVSFNKPFALVQENSTGLYLAKIDGVSQNTLSSSNFLVLQVDPFGLD